ncbi:flagellar basal body P-ring formation chaperone FlgA [Massilia endophytica]|uniref:flagellar basal body P-ring formation chaperone FlgA n=1 Tax=Massilia endophytica TaxID=2899220 RepID=UPI001E298B95|nr:flagellar basal body P-ring formation chaperone FlgA [Massilia endophytica]UGQ47961.1 flagellar basal body P-ring formation chaperone FlgA [Massilia endophytica]
MCPRLLLLGLACVAAHAAAGPVQLRLRERTVVVARQVRLADVAEVRSAPPALRAAVENLDLGPAPRAGERVRWGAAAVQRRVRGLRPEWALAWDGTGEVVVEAASQTVAPPLLVTAAEDAVRLALGALGPAAQLRQERLPAVPPVPRGRVGLLARPLDREQALRRQVAVVVDVAVDGQAEASVVVPLAVAVPQAVLVARRALSKHHVPGCDDVEVRPADRAALAADPAVADCRLLAGRLVQPLAPGEVLLSRQLEDVPAVAAGDQVSLRLATAAVVVEVRALALADGSPGQAIGVKPAAGMAAVQARVLAPGLVSFLEN